MNTNVLNRDDYKLVVRPLISEDNKDACFRYLTLSNKHLLVCQNVYDDKYINTVIESSHYFLYYHRKVDVNDIVCFALIEIKKSICDILLLCAMPSEFRFGSMIAYAVFQHAVYRKCKKFYVAPRTPGLRSTFLKYGFEHLRGVKDYDEVLVKYVDVKSYILTDRTLKRKRNNQHTKNNKFSENLIEV